MTWEYYEDLHGDEPEKPKVVPKTQDLSGLILLGLGIFAGYVIFSDDEKKTQNDESKKPIDNYDRAVANKIEIRPNPSFVSGEDEGSLSLSDIGFVESVQMENPIKDPEGGLTAEGRKHFKDTEGANLQAGVMQVETLEDLKRWGQWARRFFGRSVLPPLKTEKGEPTRLALDAQAWGCKIPKTKKEAKVIARRGSEALKYYKELKKQGLKKNDSVRFKICHD